MEQVPNARYSKGRFFGSNPCSPFGGPCSCSILADWPCDQEPIGSTHSCDTVDGEQSTCVYKKVGTVKRWSCRQ